MAFKYETSVTSENHSKFDESMNVPENTPKKPVKRAGRPRKNLVTVTRNFSLPKQVDDIIKLSADYQRMSLSQLITDALIAYLDIPWNPSRKKWSVSAKGLINHIVKNSENQRVRRTNAHFLNQIKQFGKNK